MSRVSAADRLLTAAAVRERAQALFVLAEQDALPHFRYHPGRMPAAVAYVVDTIRHNYPTLQVPFHSRWRHFTTGGVDRWALLDKRFGSDAAERARSRVDLAVASVLLDAGAGERWSYVDAGGRRHARSEGLAVASFDMFAAGLFSSHRDAPLRCDAAALACIDAGALARAMQVSVSNPLAGLDGRAALLRRLGETMAADPARFGHPGRIGHLYDHLASQASGGTLPATAVLDAVLRGLGPIWPGRYVLEGVPLGDVWHHAALSSGDATSGLVPFHKLSQWLTYSLIEPLNAAGVGVSGIDALTGLAEYRNGGLMIDIGLLAPRAAGLAARTLEVGDEAVVEWRALTVALLDRMAIEVRAALDLDAQALPLASLLEGGTWAAGRRLARERRASGAPPLAIASDGTVF